MENSKELMIMTLNLQKTSRIPVALHWWGVYKYEALGLDYRKDAWKEGEKLSDVYTEFYEKFKPDWFHLHIGTPKYFKDSEIINKNGKSYLKISDKFRSLKKEDKYFSSNSSDDEEIMDFPDYLLGSRCSKPKIDLSSVKKIDDFIKKYIHMSVQEIIEMGYTDHIPKIVSRYGDDVFLAVHIPSAICEIFDPTTGYLGFEQGLMSFFDYPKEMRYFLKRCYEEQLEWAKAYAKAGVHSFIISESYISPDLASPEIYRRFMKDVHKEYFKEIKNHGLIPICMFWGDSVPLLNDYIETNVMAIMFEESKKGFNLDIQKIRESADNRICIFGNLDSIYLLREGNEEEIKNEVARQAKGSRYNFIIANGSPVTPDTPEQNVKCLISTGRELKWH
ncbi:MAG: uroporphyrinogen decarboxylase family protein [Actinobacteria bacterium]|nr:uroporphyrinogen decarboxylase family protein [Actinomycetota bacterium]